MGLLIHPCGVPVFITMLFEVRFPILTDCGLPVRKSDSHSQSVELSPKLNSFFSELVVDDCIKGGDVVDKEHPDIGILVLQVGKGNVPGCRDGVRGGSVGAVCILKGIE